MPASAAVTRGTWEATRDTREYFEVEMPAADLSAFVEKVRAGSNQVVDVAREMVHEPDWWLPGDLAGVKRMDVGLEDNWGIFAEWRWYYSISTGRVYVFRFEP